MSRGVWKTRLDATKGSHYAHRIAPVGDVLRHALRTSDGNQVELALFSLPQGVTLSACPTPYLVLKRQVRPVSGSHLRTNDCQ